jgi:hypothetical protein
MPFIFSFTWYCNWIFLGIAIYHKPMIQINPINIVGLSISIMVLLSATQFGRGVCSAFANARKQIKKPIMGTRIYSSVRSKFSLETKIGRGFHSALAVGVQNRQAIVGTQIRTGVSMGPISIKAQTKNIIQVEKPKQKRQVNIQVEKPKHPIGHLQQPLPEEFTCPRNLDYFNQYPRPKQVPTECFTCKSLIQCVCVLNT